MALFSSTSPVKMTFEQDSSGKNVVNESLGRKQNELLVTYKLTGNAA